MANVPPQGGRKHPQQEYIQINTRNVLFVCGGAFEGLEKIVEARTGRRQIGFNEAGLHTAPRRDFEALKDVEPDDLQRFGLIPELVGRLPVIVKQYQKMIELEGVGLTFDPEAINAIARKAIDRGTGARGLRSVIEETMRDIMFDIPSRKDVREVVITKECVTDGVQPLLVLRPSAKKKEA